MIAMRVRLLVKQERNVCIGVYVAMDTNSAQMARMNSTAVSMIISSVARAFPVGRLAHPEDQNKEENEKSLN